MITIPEILKGKEVKEFVDLIQFVEDIGASTDDFYNIIFELQDFYLHTFTPEMITEYFEGWVHNLNRNFYEDGNWRISLSDNWLIIDSENRRLYFPIPETLNQFITFAYKLKLTWRE